MLKKRFLQIAVFALVLVAISSCTPKESEFDEMLLIGQWERLSPFSDEEKTGYEYYRYDIGGIGVTWDTYDDVTEKEAQEFKWTLIKSDLTLTHKIETTDQYDIPKVYTVIKLTTTELVYKDDFGITYEFTKVEESEFDESLLIGKWERPSPFNDEETQGYEYYRYDIGGIGAFWDTTDDVTEVEAQEFKWTLIKSDLTFTPKIGTADQYGIPKVYTVIKLTTTELVYKDDFGITYEFTKVEE